MGPGPRQVLSKVEATFGHGRSRVDPLVTKLGLDVSSGQCEVNIGLGVL